MGWFRAQGQAHRVIPPSAIQNEIGNDNPEIESKFEEIKSLKALSVLNLFFVSFCSVKCKIRQAVEKKLEEW